MAGGTFDKQVGKDRPGTYINFQSGKHDTVGGSDRGIVIIPLKNHNYGPKGEFTITGTITRRRSNNWLKTKIKEYAASGATPELTIQGIMNDANSDYYAAHGSDVTTVVGCVLTGDLPLTALDSEGQVVDDAINFNGKDLV